MSLRDILILITIFHIMIPLVALLTSHSLVLALSIAMIAACSWGVCFLWALIPYD